MKLSSLTKGPIPWLKPAVLIASLLPVTALLLRAASGSLGVPLRCRRAILEAAASGGGVAPQLPGDCRRCPPEPASDLLYGVALRAKERDLLPLRK